MNKQRQLEHLRRKIDSIDQELIALLDRRAACSLQVGHIKQTDKDLIYKPLREQEVLKKLAETKKSHLPTEHLQTIYREILSSSRQLQRPQQVAYLGPEGTFSYFAGVQALGHSGHFIPQANLNHVFEAVTTGKAELGVVPLENSLHGTVGQSLDLFLQHELYILSELFCKVSHVVLSKTTQLAEVQTVYSHPQPLAQCGRWLRSAVPTARLIPTESTAAAAMRASEEPFAAAIGHRKLAPLFDLDILAEAVEEHPDNWTRFVIIGRTPPTLGSQNKTSILFTLPDKAGALAKVLSIIATADINMKKLESRPMRGEKWQYVFFADLECRLEQAAYAKAIGQVKEYCHTMRILGSYPQGTPLHLP